MAFPGILTRGEFATGLITRGIKINGNYLLVDECSLNQTQEIKTLDNILQGGPGSTVSDIGAKKLTGRISFPVRINNAGEFETAFKILVNQAQNPTYGIFMDTNHLLSHYDLTAEDGGTDNNELLRIDTLMISSLTLTCSQGQAIQCVCNFEGMIDQQTSSDYSVPDETEVIGRALSWADCNVFREESSMRTTTSFEIAINNTVQTPLFLLPYQSNESGIATTRSDQIQLIGISSVKWTGKVTELIRSGSDLNTYIHGGWMVNENLTIEMGKMRALFEIPLFEISTMPFTPSVLTRSTSWIGLINPQTPLNPSGLITFN